MLGIIDDGPQIFALRLNDESSIFVSLPLFVTGQLAFVDSPASIATLIRVVP